MKVRKPLLVAVAAAAALSLPVRAAHAGYQYKSSIVVENAADGNTTDFNFKQPYTGANFVQLVPSTKAGSGGVVFTLTMKNVNCPAEGNDGGTAGKCGVKTSGGVKGHIMELGVRAIGAELPGGPGNVAAAGIPFDIIKGTAVFELGGKSTLPGNVFGALTTGIFNKPLGVGLIRLHTPGSVPTDCASAPAGPGCADGTIWAMTGILYGSDSQLFCTGSGPCPGTETETCVGGVCTQQSCQSVSDCTAANGDPVIHCDNGMCCNSSQTPSTCP